MKILETVWLDKEEVIHTTKISRFFDKLFGIKRKSNYTVEVYCDSFLRNLQEGEFVIIEGLTDIDWVVKHEVNKDIHLVLTTYLPVSLNVTKEMLQDKYIRRSNN